MYCDTALSGGQQNHAAHLSKTQGGSHIQCCENRFHREDMGGKFVDKSAKQGVDILKHSAGALFLALGCYFQSTIMQQTAAAAVALDDSITGRASRCRVYAEYAEAYISGGGTRCWAC
jgi:hypothetical protein